MSLELLQSNGVQAHIDKSGALYGIEPAHTMFGFLYFAHLVPPVKPEHTLMLGYGMGTVAELMRTIWGSCKITAVDLKGYQKPGAYMEYKMEVMDAKAYVWDSTNSVIKRRFDYIAIDLWNGKEVPDFVYETEFVVRLKEMAKKYVCLNIPTEDMPKMRAYFDYGFHFCRAVPIEGNSIQWWKVDE